MNPLYQEWLNRNSNILFPFDENSDLLCEENRQLPKNIFLDATACILSGSSPSIKVVKVVTSDPIRVTLQLNGVKMIASSLGASGVMRFRDEYTNIKIVGTTYKNLNETDRDKVFSLLHPPSISRSRIIHIPWGSGVDQLVCNGVVAKGEIQVENGHNTTLSVSKSGLVLRVATGLGKGVECPGETVPEELDDTNPENVVDNVLPTPIYYINGQKADSDGGFQIYAGEGVTVTTGVKWGIPMIEVKTSAPISAIAEAVSKIVV